MQNNKETSNANSKNTREKRKRVATGILVANSKRRVIELITYIYVPRTYKVIRTITHPDSLISMG